MATAHSKERKSAATSMPQHPSGDPVVSNGPGHMNGHAHVDTDGHSHSHEKEHEHEHERGHADSILGRGKNVLSAEVGGVATAAVIGIGAALIEVELIPGLIIGAGAILLGKMFPEIGSYARPMIKGVLRAGLQASQKLREVVAEASEEVQDLVAEVKHEREQTPEVKPKRKASGADTAATATAH